MGLHNFNLGIYSRKSNAFVYVISLYSQILQLNLNENVQ